MNISFFYLEFCVNRRTSKIITLYVSLYCQVTVTVSYSLSRRLLTYSTLLTATVTSCT